MLRKFLIVGLGGSGGKTIRYTKQALEEWFRQLEWGDGMPEGWQFLHIDTPTNQDSPVIPGAPELLKADEYLSLYPAGINFETIVAKAVDHNVSLAGWKVDPDYMDIPINMGAGQYRAIGRVLGLYQINDIKDRLMRKRSKMMGAGAGAQLREITEKLGSSVAGAEEPSPVVIVISSLAGGTGSGILVDVCDVLRSDGDTWLDDSVGLLYSADVFNELSPTAASGVQPNSAATYAEILHGYYGGGGFVPPGDGPVQQRSGPAFPYLVGQSNTKGVNFGDQLEVYRFMGRCLAAVMSDQSIQDDFTSYMMANWRSSAANFPTAADGPGALVEPPNYNGAFQALGFAEMELGVARLGTYAEQRITRDAVESILAGHRRQRAGSREYELLNEEEKIDKLSEEVFTRFLNDCEINERGKEQNQVLDALGLPEAELQNNLGAALEEIRETCRETLGKKARQHAWIDSIVDEVKVRSNGIVEEWKSRLFKSVGEWAKQTQRRILGKVGEFLAAYGAPVTIRLLERAEAEMIYVSDELMDEYHEQERLSRPLKSNTENAIGGARGTLFAEHPLVPEAIQAALNTRVVNRYQSILRWLASQLVEDFHKDLLAPLREALEEARDQLFVDTEERKEDPDGKPVTGWPRHSPDSDQAVPEQLIPGQSVKTLLDISDFPELFDDLTARSLPGAFDAIENQRREVRKHAILGDPGQTPPRRWIQVADHWHPRDTLVLEPSPKSRASFRLSLDRDDILGRGRDWLRTDGSAWNDFLSQGLRGYLSDSVPPTERNRRERRFRRQLEAAFDAAEPLASVDQEVLARIHPESELAVRPVPGEIPVRGLPVEGLVSEFLTAQFRGDRVTAERYLSRNEGITKIPVYSSLGSAFHPVVFDSLMRPIAESFTKAKVSGSLPDYWKWRRALTLDLAAPIPGPTLLAMLRGWFTGQLLGMIDHKVHPVRLHTAHGPLEFPDLTRRTEGKRYCDVLAGLIEGIAIAFPMAATMKDYDTYLKAYQQLVEWGREPGTAGSDLALYENPGEIISEWLRTGETPPRAQPQVNQEDRSERAEAAAHLLYRAIEDYRKQYDRDRRISQTDRHAWLGLYRKMIEALKQIADCLSDQAQPGPSL